MYPWDERWWTSGSFHNVFQCSAAGCMTDLEKELNLISGKKSNHSWLLAENQRNVGRTVSSQTPLRNPALGEDYCYIHLHLNINSVPQLFLAQCQVVERTSKVAGLEIKLIDETHLINPKYKWGKFVTNKMNTKRINNFTEMLIWPFEGHWVGLNGLQLR